MNLVDYRLITPHGRNPENLLAHLSLLMPVDNKLKRSIDLLPNKKNIVFFILAYKNYHCSLIYNDDYINTVSNSIRYYKNQFENMIDVVYSGEFKPKPNDTLTFVKNNTLPYAGSGFTVTW